MADATIIGELTADESTIIVMALGTEFAVARAAKALGLVTPLVKATDPRGALQMPASWPAVVQLAHIYGPRWQPQPRLTAWIARQVEQRLSPPPGESVPNAKGWTPRPYQLEGAAIIAATGRCLIFDEPGTGKSATTILGLAQRSKAGHNVFPIVVVCPASVVDPWVDQFAMWSPNWKTVAWRGTPGERFWLAEKTGAQVFIVSYDTCRIDTIGGKKVGTNPMLKLKPETVVADECHLLKNGSVGRTRAVKKLAQRADNFIALSGTPITHHPANLWPTLENLAPGAWPSSERWVGRYCTTVQSDYEETILGLNSWNEPEFRMTILGQNRRVAKADVLSQLPPKVYTVRTVELPAEWRKAYDAMEDKMLAELPDNEEELSVMGVLAQMTRLSQLACAAADVETVIEVVDKGFGPEDVIKQKVTLRAPSWKVDALLEVLEERPGRPVIATAPSRQLIMLAGQAAEAKDLRVGYVVGGQTPRERTRNVDAFQAGELDLICVTTGAGGVGITLTAADTVCFLQRPWSIVESMQMEDRAHRIGSEIHESIEIIDIVAQNTIDSRYRAVLRERAGQLGDFVQDPRILAGLLGGHDVTRTKRKRAA